MTNHLDAFLSRLLNGRLALISTILLLSAGTLALAQGEAPSHARKSAKEVAQNADSNVNRPLRLKGNQRPTTKEERKVSLLEFPEESQDRLKKVDQEIAALEVLGDEDFRAAAYRYAHSQLDGLRLKHEEAEKFVSELVKMEKRKRARYLASHRFIYNYAAISRDRKGLGMKDADARIVADREAGKDDIHFTIEIHRLAQVYAHDRYTGEQRGLDLASHYAKKFGDRVTVAQEPLKALKEYQDAYHHAYIHAQQKGGLYMNAAEARRYAEKQSGISGYMED